MSVDYCEQRMEDTNVCVGKVQKFYRDGDVACQLSLYLKYNEQRRTGAKSFPNLFMLKCLAQRYVTVAEKESGLMFLKTLYSLQSFSNVELYDRTINFVKTEMIWEKLIMAYFRALHWHSSEGTDKNAGGARHCNHFVAVILDGNFPIETR
jgi:hypothetical protein